MTDVLVVGAGSAGSILAERLSADPGCTVTVVEAGPGLDDPSIRALIADPTVLPIGTNSPVARQYRTVLTDDPAREAQIVRGSCLGGSGAINGAYFCRALPGDFEAVPGWPWTEITAHFEAVEARMPASTVPEFSAPTASFVAAAESAGYLWLPHLSVDATGLARIPLNIAGGVRVGPGAAFLEPSLSRDNLTVRTGTQVTRIRTVDGRATGVDAVGPEGPVRLDSDRVVLCAGAIATAQLLMLSGIGPADQLRSLGIGVVANLPVGQRCSDHPEWVLPTAWSATEQRPVLEAVLVTGPLEVRPYTSGFGSPTVGLGVALMRPRANGRVSLISADPSVPPRIEHRYDSEPADLAELKRGVDLVTEMFGGTVGLGGPRWSTSQHLCGTAPMGTGDLGDDAVVDPRCRVLGVDGLWVADGSVLPRIPSRGPHATIAMIGHRAAQFVSSG